MSRLELLMILVPALPLTAALITAALGKAWLGGRAHLPALVATAGALVLSLLLLVEVRGAVRDAQAAPRDGSAVAAGPGVGWEHVVSLWTWAAVPAAYDGRAVEPPPPATAESIEADLAVSGTVAEPPPVAELPAAAAATPRWYDFTIDIALRADPLTAVMLVTVTLVSLLVVIFSIGYMHGDPGYGRYFSYVSLFIFSMTMLVSASNFVLLYVFWEAVGVCSYLLIGFWFEKRSAAAAGMKAFLVNRVGDFGFALGVFLLWTTYGTLNFHDVISPEGTLVSSGILGQSRLALSPEVGYVLEGTASGGVAVAICLLLLVGACGKSAQFPLHVWLPDAMEGPTPVSALIHAATMVTAGVYLVARCTPLFWAAPTAQQVVAAIGCFTAVLAAIIAVTQTDLKRVLAYSTISQLGYMFLALGVGTLAGVTAGMFHLFTHAFFKALLFLGAGSVMHAMGGVIDMRQFSGLRRLLPTTHRTFAIGCLALAGVVPLAGFFSKDQILLAVHTAAGDGQPLFRGLYYAALVTAGLTAFYTFRAFFLTFYGPERIPAEAGHHAHESPPVMWVPLAVLALASVVVGAWFEWTGGFAAFLGGTPSLAYAPIATAAIDAHAAHDAHLAIAFVSTLVALGGIGLAAYLYLGDHTAVTALGRLLAPLYWLSAGKFFLDPIYAALVVWPLRGLAQVAYWIDRWIVDGLVNLCGRIPLAIGSLMRAMQMGMVQFYALAMVLGIVVLLGTLTLWR